MTINTIIAPAAAQFDKGLPLRDFEKRQLHPVQLRKQDLNTEDANYTKKYQQAQK